MNRKLYLSKTRTGYKVSFFAMASPAEVLIDDVNETTALALAKLAANEVWRIEDKYSRYNEQSVTGQINVNAGKIHAIDQETYALLAFAQQCFDLSDGLFDLTSGVLRKAWKFDCSNRVPTKAQVNKLLPNVGWDKISFNQNTLKLRKNMEIDFGGIGKEYAADKALNILRSKSSAPILVNLGGDLAVSGERGDNKPWSIGVDLTCNQSSGQAFVSIKKGALATSGDANRYLLKNGVRYSHILNPKTGWPIEHAPSSITVAAPNCIQAGFLATLSLLQGKDAHLFLKNQDITFW